MRNLILIVFLLSVSLAAFGQASPGAIFSGDYIKMLKKNIIFKDSDAVILTGDSDDPSSVAKTGAKGSLYVRSTNGVWYQKQDNGSSTNWTRLYFVAPLTASRAIVTDGSGLLSASTATSTQIGYLDSLTAANGGLVYSDADSLVVGTVGTSGQPLLSGGAGAYSWFSSSGVVKATSGVLSTSNVDLTSEVTGTLPVANGGTGASSLTANNVILGNGTSAVQFVAPGTNGNVLTSNGTTWQSTAPAATTITIGTIDSQTKSANGAVASGTTLYEQTADATYPGLVSTGTQTFAGNKTLSGTTNLSGLTASRPLKLDGSKNITSTQIDLASGNDVTGVVDETNGGTGQSTITTGDTLYGSASNTISKLAIGTTGQYKKVVSGLPSWQEPEFDIDNLYQEDFEGAVVAASLSTGDASSPMGGGSISGTVTDETTSFINGTGAGTTGKSIKYVEAAGSQNDYICGPEIDLGTSANRREKNNYLGFSTRYLFDGNSGEIKGGIYDVTNATFLATSLDTLNAASTPALFSTASYIPSTTQKVRWCFHVLTANSGKILYFDDIQLSNDPYKYVKLTNSTPWTNYTPVTQGIGSPTITRAQWRIVGDSIEIQARLTTGTVTGTEFQFGLPGTYAVNTGLNAEVVGYAHRDALTEAHYPVLATADDTFLNVGFRDATTANVITPKNGSYLFGSSETVTINATVPIKNLSYSVENLVTPANSPRQWDITSQISGASYTSSLATAVYYMTGDGKHFIDYYSSGTVSGAVTTLSLTVAGVTFSSNSQPLYCELNGLNLGCGALANGGSNTIDLEVESATGTVWRVQGKIQLSGKPSWADAVHTNFLAAVPANIVTSPESTHTQPKVCSFALSTTSDVLSEITGSCFSGTSCTNNGTGDTTCTFKSGYWTTQEQCSCSAATTNFGRSCSAFDSTTSVQIIRSNGASAEDGAVNVVCHGY